MISVRCLGHIGTSVGSRDVELDGGEVQAADIIERLRSVSGMSDPGFTKFNTLVMIEEGEAFVPAGVDKLVRDGQKVVLLPFSHGG